MKNIRKTPDEYQKIAQREKPSLHRGKNIFKAFWVGGVICLIGQGFWELYVVWGLSQEDAGALASITMILLGGILTGIGVYDEIGQFAGAGSIVPVTGFANAVVSPAMEFRQEGLVLGMGAKMYVVAGPVLTYGMVSAFIVGVLKLILGG